MGAGRPEGGAETHGPATWLNTVTFWPFWATVGAVFKAYFRVRVVNRPSLKGPHVLVANHASFLDPLVVGSVLPRRVVFMMTVLHFRSPLLGWFYRWNRAIPLHLRGGNRDGMRAARAALERGEVVGIFPEGGLSRDGLPLLGNPGAVSLVLGEGVPIVPVHVEGAYRAFPSGALLPRPRRITVRFGEPLSESEMVGDEKARRARLARATRVIMDRIAELGGQVSRERWLEARGEGTGPLSVDPGEGLGAVRFGMLAAEVEAMLGVEHVWEAWMGGNLNASLCYPGLVLRFDAGGSGAPPPRARLEAIEVRSRDDVSLFGRSMWKWTRDGLVEHCQREGIESDTRDGTIELAGRGTRAVFDEAGRLDRLALGPV